MRKAMACLLAIAMLPGFLTGCNRATPKNTKPAEPTSGPAEETRPEPVEFTEDTYWTAESWLAEDGEDFTPVNMDLRFMDLLLRTDGTARFRDVYAHVCLMDDSSQSLRWERTEDGHFLFFNRLYSHPVLDGVYEDGILRVEYQGMTIRMKQEEIPDTPGKDTLPAELAGTWIMVSGETEGYEWTAMPTELASLVIYATDEDARMILMADMEERDHYGALWDSSYGLKIQLLEIPLYEGHANELWSARIGEESPEDANGFPVQTEIYVALLNYNTLQMQRYYTLDGYPAVSYQTYIRFPDLVSWRSPEQMELKYSNWELAAYTDYSGNAMAIPKELEGLSICLDDDGICYLQYPGETVEQGRWQLEHGGVILLQSPEEAQLPFWFAGAVSGYDVEENCESTEEYQMELYYRGGILKLALSSYG